MQGSARETQKGVGSGLLVLVTCAIFLLASGGQAQGKEDEEEFSMENIPREFMTAESQAELGFFYSTEDSFRFGDFTGLEEGELYFLGNLDLWGRDPYDRGARYWRVQGANLGLASRAGRLSYGEQGRYALSFYFDQLPKLRSDTNRFVFGGNGGTLLTLPAVWVANSDPALMTELTPNLQGIDVKHERRTLGGELSLLPFPGFELTANYDRQNKQGTKVMGAVIGSSGGNPRSALIPERMDWVTDRFNLSLAYATDRAQMELGYHLSLFDNRDDAMRWEVPYLNGAWAAAAQYPTGTGTKGLAPDNRFDQISFAGGYNLLAQTRVTLNLGLGRMKQDETFLPFTGNSLLLAPIGLPRDSLEGEINTAFARFGIVSRPLEKLTLEGSYRYDERDNDTPRDIYVYVPGDSQNQAALPTGTARINHPYGYTSNELGLGARYQLLERTDVAFDYELETIDRDFQEVDRTRENRYAARLTTRPTDFLSGRLKLGHAVRKATHYKGADPFLDGHTPGYIATLAANVRFENHPLLRRYHLADRNRNEVGAQVSLMPHEMLSIDLGATLIDDEYDRTSVGLTDRRAASYTLDVSLAPTETMTLYGFYALERWDSDQEGWSFSGGANKIPHSTNPLRRWSQEDQDDIHTVGGGVKKRLLGDRLELGVDYLFSHSKTRIDVDTGPALTAGPGFPHVVTRLHSFRIGAEYKLRESLSVRAGYLYEKFDWKDWAFDEVLPGNLIHLISLGQGTPSDRASLFAFSLVYKFH